MQFVPFMPTTYNNIDTQRVALLQCATITVKIMGNTVESQRQAMLTTALDYISRCQNSCRKANELKTSTTPESATGISHEQCIPMLTVYRIKPVLWLIEQVGVSSSLFVPRSFIAPHC